MDGKMEIIYETRTAAIDFGVTKQLASLIHLHKELEVVHVLEGTAVAYADKNCCVLNPGDTFVAFPNQIHYYKNDIPGKFILLIFSAELIYGMGSRILESLPDKNVISNTEEAALHGIFRDMMGIKENYYDMILQGYTNVMMGLLLSHIKLVSAESEKSMALREIVKYCSKNYRENITLDSVAEQLHLSKYYISHLLNQKLNRNFREYVNHQRIAQACLLLRETDTKIVDIAEMVGFGTLRSFNRSFKTVIGVSPICYREENARLVKQNNQIEN